MTTTAEILTALAGLDAGDFDVHVVDEAWYSARSLTRAIASSPKLFADLPKVAAVRVRLRGGMLELLPQPDGPVKVMCYCCFGGEPDRGTFPLGWLRGAVAALKDHYCPPWPG